MKNKNFESYQANVHATYQRNREELTRRVWNNLRKNFVPIEKKRKETLDTMTPIWYNTTINNKKG